MKVEQVADLANSIVLEEVGEEATLLKEDLSNVVQHGTAAVDAMGVENYTRELVDRIGKVTVSNRLYNAELREAIVRDDWQYGSVYEKISFEPNVAVDSEMWQLEDGQVYEETKFTMPKAQAKFYNGINAMRMDISRPTVQANSAFARAEDFVKFISGLDTQFKNDLEFRIDTLSKRILNNMIAETMYDLDDSGSYTGKSGKRAINVLYLYNQKYSKSLTTSTMWFDPDFIRFVAFVFECVVKDMETYKTLYNIGGKYRHTPRSKMKGVILNQFKAAADIFLQSNTFHDNYTKLPNLTTISQWQGSGEDVFDLDTRSNIKITTSEGHDVETGSVVACLYDIDSVGIHMEHKATTSHFVSSARFYNYFSFWDARFWCDNWENFVVLYAA